MASLGRLPQLELLLARAQRRHLEGGWRDWLCASLAPGPLLTATPAVTVGAAFSGPVTSTAAPSGQWLATPVHLFAGLDSLHVHPDGLLTLSNAQQQILVEDFNRVFADAPWRLHRVGQRELLLSGPLLDADGADPATLMAADPGTGMPKGADAGALRLLGSEVEMWLHGHALNQQREAGGELVVTGLWWWGATAPRPISTLRLQKPRLFGRDSYAAALAHLLKLRTGDITEVLADIQAVPIRVASDTVVLMQNLAQIEHQVMAQALQAVRQRRMTLHVLAGCELFTLPPRRWLQWWRRPQPWWQVLR
jgi:hypothetical protein